MKNYNYALFHLNIIDKIVKKRERIFFKFITSKNKN